jgi:ABC-type sugar transport system permease subunit
LTQYVSARSMRQYSSQEQASLRRRYALRRNITGWAFLLPLVIPFTVFLLIPVIAVFWYSTQQGDVTGGTHFVGLDNWAYVFSRSQIMTSVLNTVKFAAISVPIIVAASLGAALLLQRVARGASVFRFAVYFPVLVPGIVAGLMWIFMIHPDFGLLSVAVRLFGLEPPVWLGPGTALVLLAFVDVWRSLGYWAVFLLAGLMGLPREMYEAANLDGANALQRFRYVTVPQLRPILLFALVVSTIWALQIFDTVYIMTRGGPGTATVTMVWFVYNEALQRLEVGPAAAISVVLLLGILALTLVQMRLLRGPRVG